jgi:Hemerythrin HHE cation binding domain
VSSDTGQAFPAEEGLVGELKWVHAMIRQDLRTVRRLAAEVTAGPLWQLKVNCLRYCRFVHMHHHAESAFLFPRLRRSNPALGPRSGEPRGRRGP